MRKRIVAVFLTFMVVVFPLAFSAAAEEETCEIYVNINGVGTVTVDDIERDDSFTGYYPVGESVTMVATPEEGNEFLFWVNRESNRVVSWEESYTFYAATYASYEAVFDTAESDATADGNHTVVYLTSGENIVSFQQRVPLEYTGYYSSVSTTGMYLSGKTWTGWDKTADQVAATEGRVYVHPIYNTEASFIIKSTVNGVTTTREAKYLSTMTLVAPEQYNGQAFSYWNAIARDVNAHDEVASFYSTYQFIVTGDVELEAVYGEPYPNGEGISCRISGDFPSFNESTVTIFAEHSVTADYTVLQHGMVLTKNLQIGSFADSFQINENEPAITKMTSKDTTLAGSYRANVINWTPVDAGSYSYYPRIFARPYVIATDANGVTHTFYGEIYCVEYVLETGSGGGTNIDDPWG